MGAQVLWGLLWIPGVAGDAGVTDLLQVSWASQIFCTLWQDRGPPDGV